jgi:iron complex transport system ATP-binding protein
LPQSVHPSQPFTVRQTVELGARISDDSNIDDLLIALDIKHLSARTLTQLSGGEYQRALVASVLAERPRFLLLDEPSSSLDLHHQINLFKMLASIAADGLGIAVVCHDLNIASLFADKIYLLHHGCIAVSGKPCDVITQNNIDAVFGTGVSVNQIKNRPVVVPSDD